MFSVGEVMSPDATGRDGSVPALGLLLVIYCFLGYSTMINGASASALLADFGLSQAGLARVFIWLELGSFGAVILARWMDRVGRRQVLLVSIVGFASMCLGTALSPNLVGFVVAQALLAVFGGTAATAVGLIIGEELRTAERARGLALSGIVLNVGTGVGLVAVPLLSGVPGAWRWAWALGALVLGLLFWAPSLRETRRFVAAEQRGETSGRWTEILAPRWRTRALAVLAAYFGMNFAVGPVMFFLILFVETALDAPRGFGSGVLIGGGALGLLGFPLGALLANRLGRRLTAMIGGVLYSVFAGLAYSVTPDAPLGPLLLVALAFGVATVCVTAAHTALRTAQVELFPTHLRGTLAGSVLFVAAVAGLLGMSALALMLAFLGGLSEAMPWIAAACAPGFVLFAVLVPETRGMELEEGAQPESPSA